MTAMTGVCMEEAPVRGDDTCMEKEKHFTEGLRFYKLFWIFLIGSVVGFIVETIWCLIKSGQFESRTSLIFGPFTVVYGIGALVLYIGLNRFGKGSNIKIFLFGMAAGTIVEHLCSWAQEAVFGTVSWDYSGVPFNIGGRVCLLYSVFWGLMALAWVRLMLPVLNGVIRRIPNSCGRQLTWAAAVIMAVIIVVSGIAVSRWMARMDGVKAAGNIALLCDRYFPNSFMEAVYPNMIIC